MPAIRPCLSVLFALALAFASVSMAVARGQAPAAHQVTICTVEGMMTLSLDADGNPTDGGGVHLCPDCVMAGGALVPSSGPALHAPLPRASRAAVLPEPRVSGRDGRAPFHPRAPPGAARVLF